MAELLAELVPSLPTPKPTRIVVIGCGVEVHFPWDRACRAFDGAVCEIRKQLDTKHYTVISAPTPVEDPDELISFLNHQLAQGVDGLVLFPATYTAGEIGSQLGRWLNDHPVPLISWSMPEPATESCRLKSNSLCYQNFLLNMYAQPVIARFARTVRARARFLHARVLHIGGSRVTAFYDGEVDKLAVMRRFGLRFDRIDLHAAFDHARKFKDADLRRLRDAIVNSPSCARNDVPDKQIFQTLRIGLAALDLAAQQNYAGCIVKSWPELIDQYGCTTDGSVSMLNDFGLYTAVPLFPVPLNSSKITSSIRLPVSIRAVEIIVKLPPFFNISGCAEETFRFVQSIGINTTGKNFPAGRNNGVIRSRQTGDAIFNKMTVSFLCSTRRLAFE